jgi:N-acetylneuraminate synthase/N,N'-diacetyllegionaminate synthase
MKRTLVAEIGSCNGDLALAIDTAEAALDAGAAWVKGQMFTADRLVTRTAPGYGKDSIVEADTQHDSFKKALSYDEWGDVADRCDGRFFASVFDLEACADYPYEWIKLASGDITYRALVEAAAGTGKRLIMSTGAATLREIHRARSWIPTANPVMLACTLSYPTEARDANVNRVTTMQSLKWDAGYSDHTRGTAAAHLAFDLGASMVEKHFTIKPNSGGDHDFAIGPSDVTEIVNRNDAASDAVTLVYGGSDVIGPRSTELPAIQLARRSIHAAVDIPAGTIIRSEMLSVLRPTGGFDPWLLNDPDGPVGKHTRKRLVQGDPVGLDAFYGFD